MQSDIHEPKYLSDPTLGVTKDECLKLCNRTCGSGCDSMVSGYQFDLCRDCFRKGYSTNYPTVVECEIGCSNHGEI